MLKDALNKFKTLSKMLISCTQSSFSYWKLLCLLEYFTVYVDDLDGKQPKDVNVILRNLNRAMKCVMQGSPQEAVKYMKAAHKQLVKTNTTGLSSDFFTFDRFTDD